MLSKMNTRAYAAGECVFRQGDPATAVYIVTKGDWEVGTEPDLTPPPAKGAATKADAGSSSSPLQYSQSGPPPRRTDVLRDLRVVARLGPGDHFGETALLEDRNHRNTTVRCTSPCARAQIEGPTLPVPRRPRARPR